MVAFLIWISSYFRKYRKKTIGREIKIKKGQTPLSHKRRMPPPLSLTSLSKDYGEETTSNKLFTVYTQFLELSLILFINLRISAFTR